MKALQKIHDEHRSLSAVLHGLKQLARDVENASQRPDFAALRAMVRYIDEFPEKLHHPKEDKYLFAKIMQRAPESLALVRRLTAEHEKGAQLIRELERALVLVEDAWPKHARAFHKAVEEYAQFHWDHMRAEERELLPLAEKHLSAEDWAWIDEAFAANRDPVSGVRERDMQELFTRIVSLAPAPIGLGTPWKATQSR